MKKNNTLLSQILTLILFTILLINTADAAQLKGKVIKTIQKQVEIELEGDLLPQIGDSVEIGFILPSIGFVALKGEWSISAVIPKIVADPKGETKQPQNGQLITIRSSAPQKRQDSRYADSVNDLADDYYYGRNAHKKDYIKAMKLFRQAAAQGSLDAMTSIGYMYALGQGTPKNNTKAVEWFRKAAQRNDINGQRNLGVMYQDGKGIKRDYQAAAKWYRKAADKGDLVAQRKLGILYTRGHGVPQDYKKAIQWYRKSADQGDLVAQNNLGNKYKKGNGVAQNYLEAARWYRKAASQGNAKAQTNLGILYDNGFGVAKSN